MLIIDNFLCKISNQNIYKYLTNDSDGIFLDIETTGFSRDRNIIYLIGLLFKTDIGAPDSGWALRLMLAEKENEEKELLTSFLSFLAGRQNPRLITFNGVRFDLPFLTARLKHAGYDDESIPPCLTCNSGFDIFRIISPFKKILGLENLKQKTVEQFLGINREDKYNGGELINVFHAYASSGNEIMKNLLLSHNHDDVLGMSEILPILCYAWLFSGHENNDFLTVKNSKVITDFSGSEERPVEMIISFESKFPFISNHVFDNGSIVLSINGSSGELHLPIVKDTLYHFFTDYKNYFYIPSMDTAIHKSVAQFMDNEDKKKATADNCYVKKTGNFISQAEPVLSPVFKKCRKEKCTYFCIDDLDLDNTDLQTYMLTELAQLTK